MRAQKELDANSSVKSLVLGLKCQESTSQRLVEFKRGVMQEHLALTGLSRHAS